MPRPFARTGVIGNFYFIAQWFPKLGVLEDGGWNCHQFHATTEFFSDFGVYDVSLTVPRGWRVGATGAQRARIDNSDGTTTHVYHQEDVHDFAWTTSPTLVERTADFVPSGRTAGPDATAQKPVRMRLLLQPEHRSQAERHFAATRTALKHYSEWFGAYPYDQITIVDPAFQSEADGMEYPTLITGGTPWLTASAVTIATPEEVVIHETGHQFFYGIVGHNEFEDAWMDEGLNTYLTARALDAGLSAQLLRAALLRRLRPVGCFAISRCTRETYWNRLAGYRRAPKSDVPSTPSYRYSIANGRTVTYNKTALWLNTLERHLGWPVMQRALQTYFQRWQFRHPKPADFFAIVNEVSGQDLTWFFDQVHRSSNVFDYAIDTLRSTRDGSGFRTDVIVSRARRGDLPGRRGRDVRRRRTPRRAMGRARPLDAVHLHATGARGDGRGRSRPRAAARCERHEQLAHAEGCGRNGGDEVVAEMDGLAAGPPAHLGVPRMSRRRVSAWTAWRAGIRLVNRAPAILLAVWLLTLLFSVPLGLGVRRDIERQLGASLEADRQTSGVTYDWLSEFGDQASGASDDVWRPCHRLCGGRRQPEWRSSIGTSARSSSPRSASVTRLLWTLMAGGIIDRYARNRRDTRARLLPGGWRLWRPPRAALPRLGALLRGAVRPLPRLARRTVRAVHEGPRHRANGVPRSS